MNGDELGYEENRLDQRWAQAAADLKTYRETQRGSVGAMSIRRLSLVLSRACAH